MVQSACVISATRCDDHRAVSLIIPRGEARRRLKNTYVATIGRGLIHFNHDNSISIYGVTELSTELVCYYLFTRERERGIFHREGIKHVYTFRNVQI